MLRGGFRKPCATSVIKIVCDSRHLASGHALHIHFCQGQLDGPFGAGSTLEPLRIESTPLPIDFAYLRHGDGDLSQSGVEGLVFVAVGMARVLLGRLVQRRSAALETK